MGAEVFCPVLEMEWVSLGGLVRLSWLFHVGFVLLGGGGDVRFVAFFFLEFVLVGWGIDSCLEGKWF